MWSVFKVWQSVCQSACSVWWVLFSKPVLMLRAVPQSILVHFVEDMKWIYTFIISHFTVDFFFTKFTLVKTWYKQCKCLGIVRRLCKVYNWCAWVYHKTVYNILVVSIKVLVLIWNKGNRELVLCVKYKVK